MTSPVGDYLVDQVAALTDQVATLASAKVTFMTVPVTSVNTATATFGVTIPNLQDGSSTPLTGVPSPPQFLPSQGQTVTLAVAGPTVVYQPTQIAAGAISVANLSPNAPNAPTGLSLSTASTVATDGSVGATVTATWSAPTTTIGGSPISGTLTYQVQYRPTGRIGWSTASPAATTATFNALPGVGQDVQVSAVDQLGNVGAATAISNITAGKKTAPPGTPSTPTIANYLGQLKITWDGLLGGAAPALDFSTLEVHVSTSSTFTPSAATLVGNLSTGGSVYAATPYGTTEFAAFVAIDTSGNRSSTSAKASGATGQVVSADIFAGAVGSSQLANLAVTTAAINSLAVNDAKIGNMAVGKLTAGTMTADVVMSGRFATSLTGARTEVNSLGFQKFASDGVTKVISLTSTESILSGNYSTATTGRRIVIGASGNDGQIDFWSPDGDHCFVRGVTESTGVEDIQVGLDLGGHALWNRIFINSNAFMGYHAATQQLNFLASGSFFVNQYTSSASSSTGLVTRLLLNSGGYTYRDTSNFTRMVLDSNFAYRDGSNNLRLTMDGSGFTSTDTNGSAINFSQQSGYSTTNTAVAIRTLNSSGVGSSINTVWGGTPAHIEFRDAANTIFYPITGGTYTTGSSSNGKSNITDYTSDAMAKIRGARPRTYQRNAPGNVPDPTARVELGLLAEEAPPEVVNSTGASGIGVDVYALATLNVAALQALDARVTALEHPKGPPGP